MARLEVVVVRRNGPAGTPSARRLVLGRFGAGLASVAATVLVAAVLVTALVLGYVIAGLVIAALLVALRVGLVLRAFRAFRG